MLVTSFLLQRDGKSTHSVDKYFFEFQRMRKCINSKIILFLDNQFSPSLFESEKTIVVPTRLEETETYSLINSHKNLKINYDDNPIKNTKDYHTIINSKTEFMIKAFSFIEEEKLAWVDFGIGHVISDDKIFKKLENIQEINPGITIPGCWNGKYNLLNHPSWRFCGGFFAGDKASINSMHSLSRVVLQKTLPELTWEVNIWSIMESLYNFPFLWYKADHNDTIFNY